MNNPTVNLFSDADVISSYSRADAIADGVLVEAPEKICREAGWKIPLALTIAAWVDCVAWTEEETKRKRCPQDVEGRLWDVLYMGMRAARHHIARCEASPELDPGQCLMQVYRVPKDGRGSMPRLTQLQIDIGPGDDGAPVATIMMIGED